MDKSAKLNITLANRIKKLEKENAKLVKQNNELQDKIDITLNKIKKSVKNARENLKDILDETEYSDCYGCLNEYSGQKDHMECPNGCLHNPENCFICL